MRDNSFIIIIIFIFVVSKSAISSDFTIPEVVYDVLNTYDAAVQRVTAVRLYSKIIYSHQSYVMPLLESEDRFMQI